MQAYDIFILLLLIAATVWGVRRGLAKQLATLDSFILGYLVAVNFRGSVAPMIDVAPPWNSIVATLILFMGSSLVIWIAFRFLSSGIAKMGLMAFDAQMGGLFGLAKGGLIAMFLTVFALGMLGEQPRNAVLKSFSGYNICRWLNRAPSIVPAEWQQAMEPYLQTIEAQPQFVDHASPVDDLVESPSDFKTSGVWASRYVDPDFGNFETAPVGRTATDRIRANRSSDNRHDQNWGALPTDDQATLHEPIFDSR